jgi:hypothetical protein
MTGDDACSAGDRVSDQALETKVKSALIGDDRVKARNIEVEVRNGVVSLAGTVDSSAEAPAHRGSGDCRRVRPCRVARARRGWRGKTAQGCGAGRMGAHADADRMVVGLHVGGLGTGKGCQENGPLVPTQPCPRVRLRRTATAAPT